MFKGKEDNNIYFMHTIPQAVASRLKTHMQLLHLS
jgi:hypothetical protein